MKTLLMTSAVALVAALASPANAANLIGQSATATFTVNSTANDLVQFASPQTVGAGVEFTGSFEDVFAQDWTLALDVEANGFSVTIADGVNGNIRRSDGSEYIRFNLSGLSGLGAIQLASYTCTPPDGFACGVANGGPNIVALGSDSTSAFVGLSGIRNGERYAFSFGPGVPEPTSWALMIAGFGLAGTAMRRRSVRVAFA